MKRRPWWVSVLVSFVSGPALIVLGFLVSDTIITRVFFIMAVTVVRLVRRRIYNDAKCCVRGS